MVILWNVYNDLPPSDRWGNWGSEGTVMCPRSQQANAFWLHHPNFQPCCQTAFLPNATNLLSVGILLTSTTSVTQRQSSVSEGMRPLWIYFTCSICFTGCYITCRQISSWWNMVFLVEPNIDKCICFSWLPSSLLIYFPLLSTHCGY